MKVTITIEKETFSNKEFSVIAHVQGVLENLFGRKAVKREIKTDKKG